MPICPDQQLFEQGQIDLVTETDLAEELLVQGFQQAFPKDAILGEEGDIWHSGFTWIIDPIDGTTNFSCRLRCHLDWTKISPIAGLWTNCSTVHQLVRQLWDRARAEWQTYRRKQRKGTRGRSVGNRIFTTGKRPDNNVAEFDHLLRKCRGLRRMGAAALDFAYVAAGWLDGYWEYLEAVGRGGGDLNRARSGRTSDHLSGKARR